ncbi:GIY-YIG nuclease family protein [Roseiarcaceae bacterium H3SJ34-1]|uniref:GIY-YIG nuclease family protein n=1 Tax=Terripilifer ovatus TaxID=3032367 RepID=UPI003AB921F4|nr:GIY-YIG nuclease family protein [Roseiarcaceae bacterium H3SJ34-1]
MTSDGASVYVLKCADGSYYRVSTRRIVDERFAEHCAGLGGDYTRRRLPVELIHPEHFQRITDAIAFERQFKGWSRNKKEAFLRGDFDGSKLLASRGKG